MVKVCRFSVAVMLTSPTMLNVEPLEMDAPLTLSVSRSQRYSASP
jgi:hypothetical protein